MSSKNRVTINVSEEERAGIVAMADKFHVSAAWIGRQALREFIEKYQHTETGFPLPLSSAIGSNNDKQSLKVSHEKK